MKHIIALALLLIASGAFAATDYTKYMPLVTPIEGAVLTQSDIEFLQVAARVKGYTKKNGTYVAPHHRSNPNGTKIDNYSSEGRINPYTGQEGRARVGPK